VIDVKFTVKAVRFSYLTLLAITLLLTAPSIAKHFLWLLGGESLPHIVIQRWDIALVNILFFLIFLALFQIKKHVNWRKHNIYAAFIIALFAEMYGFPLTAYFAAKYVGAPKASYQPAHNISFSFMGADLTMNSMMIIGGAITVGGLLLIIAGWHQVHKKRGTPVTDGLYKYARHPQYTGILLVAFGWIIHWPTALTLLMLPVLVRNYINLARE